MKTVGVFDSGVGGLSVLRALLAELPGTRFVYAADSAYAPYGERTALDVSLRTERVTALLRERHGIDALVVACNTATAHAINALREHHPDLPIVGVEPALKPAAALSRNGHVGVLATRGTLGSARYAQLRERVVATATRPLHFTSQPCDGLAGAIERHDLPTIQSLSERYVHEMKQADTAIDTVVLGCTHYPFVLDQLAALCGPGLTLVDTGVPVARRTREVLGVLPTEKPSTPPAPLLLSSGPPDALAQAAQRWLGLEMSASPLFD